jgi:hypothetical protein
MRVVLRAGTHFLLLLKFIAEKSKHEETSRISPLSSSISILSYQFRRMLKVTKEGKPFSSNAIQDLKVINTFIYKH